MSSTLVLVFEVSALVALGLRGQLSQYRFVAACCLGTAAAASWALADAAAGGSALAVLHAPLHAATLAVVAALIGLVSTPDDADGARRELVLVTALLALSASNHWLAFAPAFLIVLAFLARSGGARFPGFVASFVCAAAGLVSYAQGHGVLVAASDKSAAEAASPVLLTLGLVLLVVAGVALILRFIVRLAGVGLREELRGDELPSDDDVRSWIAESWSAVLLLFGPVAHVFPGAEWREATGGWQGVVGVLGALASVGVALLVLRASTSGWALPRAGAALLSLQAAAAMTYLAGTSALASTGALRALVVGWLGYLLVLAAKGQRGLAAYAGIVLASGVPFTAAFWARIEGATALVEAGSVVLLLISVLSSLAGAVLGLSVVLDAVTDRDVTGTCSRFSRIVAAGLVIASFLPDVGVLFRGL